MKKAPWIIGGLFVLFLMASLAGIAAWQTIQRCESIVESSQRNDDRVRSESEAITMEQCLGVGQGGGEASGPPGASPPRGGFSNGRLPFSVLEAVSSHGDYSCLLASYNGAADAWRQLAAAARQDGMVIEGGWCYRTYEAQEAAWSSRRCFIVGNCDGNPYPPTARPGTSNHGWGLAVDVWNAWNSILSCSDPEFVWMQFNAPRFGWVNPAWARCGRGSQEPWHWEYVG